MSESTARTIEFVVDEDHPAVPVTLTVESGHHRTYLRARLASGRLVARLWDAEHEPTEDDFARLRGLVVEHIAGALVDDELYPVLFDVLTRRGADGYTPGFRAAVGEPVEVGDLVRLHSRGQDRYTVVTHVTRTGSVTGAYITNGGLAEAARYGSGLAKITRKVAKAGSWELVAKVAR